MKEPPIYINISLFMSNDTHLEVIVSEELLQIFRLVNYVIITGPVSIFGIIFNIINIVVFIKIGFNETINISLLALAVSDLASILPLVWMSVYFNPLVPSGVGSLDFQAVQVVIGWPHVCFSRVTGCLTAFITFERYLCVALPLKIKTIVTPRRTVIIIIFIFILIIGGIIPEYFSFELHTYIDLKTNHTLLGLIYHHNGREIENYVVSFAAFCQLTTFIFVIVSTALLVRTLSHKSKWRKTTSNSSENSTLSARERRTVQMIVSLSAIFIASYLPLSVSLLGMVIVKEYSIQGRYNNLLVGTATFFLCLESINSSVNIFIYYNMSSRYRFVFLKLIGFQRSENNVDSERSKNKIVQRK